jgi:pilus assembly protein CpaC
LLAVTVDVQRLAAGELKFARQPDRPAPAGALQPPMNMAPGGIAPEQVMPGAPQPFDMQHPRLEALPNLLPPFAATPKPTPEVAQDFDRFVAQKIDPQETLDIVKDRPRVLVLKQPPKRVQIPDEKVATYSVLTEREIAVIGKEVGSTVLNLWFDDAEHPGAEKVLSYLIRVIPDPEAKARLDRMYDALADEINHEFPNSHVELAMVGDKLIVRGEAIDAVEATQILTVVRANAPGQQQDIPVNQVNVLMTPDQMNTADAAAANSLGQDSIPGVGVENYLLRGSPNIINLLKIPGEQQVMLKVTVAEVNRTAARSIGLNFSLANQAGQTVFANLTGGLITNATVGGTTGTTSANLPALLDNGQIFLAIQALRTLNFARSLAEPNLVTVNGRPASFQAGGEFPVPAASLTFGAVGQGVRFVPFGVAVQFVPYITDRDRIRLQILGRVSTRDPAQSANIGGTNVPGLQARTFSTTLELREGQTLALAGLVQNNFGSVSNRVPFFGDLPLVGRFLANDSNSAQEQELVVLITPQLVHPLEHHEVSPLPGSDIFEPGDIEFFLLARLESRRMEDFRSSVRTDLARIKRYEHCQDIFILGPHGHCDPPGGAP